MDLIEAENIKKKWQEYTEELHKKDLMEKFEQTFWPIRQLAIDIDCVQEITTGT